jgi:hypothetical protein
MNSRTPISILFPVLCACVLSACAGNAEDEGQSEAEVRGRSLAEAQQTVKRFYEHGIGPAASYPQLTAEANAKLKEAWDNQRKDNPYFDDGGYENPFTGFDGHLGIGSFNVDAPQYVQGLQEAVMTVHTKGADMRNEELVTVRVRVSDLKISDVSLNIHDCGGESWKWNLVGQYGMKAAYPSTSNTGGRVEVYWSEESKENCVIARCVERCDEKMLRSLKVRADGADWVTDSGQFSLFAGPVKVRAPGRCIDVRANFGDEGVAGSSSFDNKHCD